MVRLASLIEELEQREAAARERVSELRAQIADLTEQLETAEERLVQLEGPASRRARFLTRWPTTSRPRKSVPGDARRGATATETALTDAAVRATG
ncbi:hypothetical protein GCM10010278_81040 [Streptomyces melanogenes]|nr:hypothetical protein GCM10010278_81040 [Streptomyces melanogenes]